MKKTDFLKDNIWNILIFVIIIFLLVVFLSIINVSMSVIVIICTLLLFAFVLSLSIAAIQKYKFYKDTFSKLEELDKKYLIAEVMPEPMTKEQMLIKRILQISNKSVIEEINHSVDSQKAYKEYIESWIHEVKLPITAIKLICENNKSDITDNISTELSQMELQVENVLYFARSENVYMDYIIHNVFLEKVITEAVAEQKRLFISNKVSIDVDETLCGLQVSSDEKWIQFLLKQIFTNCVKYRNDNNPHIKIYASKEQNSIILTIMDNGIGILPQDLPRIFDKGYTGNNGRQQKASTGIGLYLCKCLCDKLGIGIACESQPSQYTKMSLIFPNSTHNKL